jgi:hypothetical protein
MRFAMDIEINSKDNASGSKPLKRPYEKPAFRHERVFETMALACGKVQATQQQCRSNRKNS